MTAVHPHQLKPNQDLRDHALLALSYTRAHIPLVGVPTITRYLRNALQLSVHREVVLGWLAAGMPHSRVHRRGGRSAPLVVVTTNDLALDWLAKHGSIRGARLCPVVGPHLRVSRSLTLKATSQNKRRVAHRDINPMRGKKPTKRKGRKGRVNDV